MAHGHFGWRYLVHAGALLWALALPWSPPVAWLLFLAFFALANLVLPAWLPWVLPADRPGSGHLETVHYPAAVLAGFIGFAVPSPALEAGHPWYAWPLLAWATLALGDPWLSYWHRRLSRGPSLPWNERKRVLPLILTLVTVTPLLTWFFWAKMGLPWAWCAPAIAMALIAETIWVGVDDNWLIPFTVCLVAGFHYASSELSRMPPAHAVLSAVLPLAFAVIGYARRRLTVGGAFLGWLGSLVLFSAHPALFFLLCGFFLLGIAATAYGMPSKERRGIAENRQGQRGMAEVFGAMGLAVWTAPLALITRHLGGTETEIAQACLIPAAAWIAKGMDTVSSEIGKAVGGPTYSPTALRRVPPGTVGGWSLAGSLAGVAAALILAGIAWICGLAIPWQAGVLLSIAVAANAVESLWAGFWAQKNIHTGVHANLIMTLSAVFLAWLVFLR